MRKLLRKFLVPHHGNQFIPHILREQSVFMLAAVIVALFFLPLFNLFILQSSDFYAAIIPKILVELANIDRRTSALTPLSVNPLLEAAAQQKAYDMANKGYFAHISPEGRDPWYWFTQARYNFSYAGENLAVNFVDSSDVERAWMNSPGHRANILNGHFTEIGIATAKGMYEGRETIFVVQMFGRPSASARFAAAPVVPVVPVSPPAPVAPAPAVPAPSPATPPAVTEVAEANIEVLQADEMFIAVKNTGVVDPDAEPAHLTELPPPTKASALERLAVSPKSASRTAYLVLGALIFTSMMLTLFIEIEKRHPRHIAYAVFLLLLIATSVYFADTVGIFKVLVI